MATPKETTESVHTYITDAPKWARPILRELRKTIRSAAPKSKESISYHMPYYSQNGRLAYFSVAKNHCSFHWISAEDKKVFSKELSSQDVVGNTLHIPREGKVPVSLIKKIVRSRIKSNTASKK